MERFPPINEQIRSVLFLKGGETMEIFNQGLEIIQTAVIALGGFVAAWGLIQIGLGYKDHASPQIQQGLGWLVGGAIIIAAAGLIMTIKMG